MKLKNVLSAPVLVGSLVACLAGPALAALPPVPVPPENPITENKRVLGKVLFFDEQLSTDNTMACATCHLSNRGGSDPRRLRNPGADGLFNTADDMIASPGVVRSTAFNQYLKDAVYDLRPQVTGRTANAPINAAYANLLFWDGRATSQFIEPQGSRISIVSGGALESQVVGPPVNSVEMAHDGMDWTQICVKLANARPLAAATSLPADLSAALVGQPDYKTLFTRAFGDSSITAERVAFAIATFERTLIADQTPWDRTQAGQPGGLSVQQQRGANAFIGSGCNACHTAPLFTDNNFRAIGVRPPAEDRGRAVITGNNNDRGKFKTPSLRNVGLKPSFFHNGQLTQLNGVIGFYANPANQFPDNRDPLMNNVNIPPPPPPGPPGSPPPPPGAGADIQEFIQNGLTDPRVAAQAFPFDRATLYTESIVNRPAVIGGGVAGSGGVIPQILVIDPPFVGNTAFRIGLDRARGGTGARLMLSTVAPVEGKLVADRQFGLVLANGLGTGNGFATQPWPLKAPAAQQGQTLFAQWAVSDPGAPGGMAYSTVAQFRFFCGDAGCAPSCVGDYDNNHQIALDDIFTYLNAWFTQDIRADVDGAASVVIDDIFVFLNAWFAGC